MALLGAMVSFYTLYIFNFSNICKGRLHGCDQKHQYSEVDGKIWLNAFVQTCVTLARFPFFSFWPKHLLVLNADLCPRQLVTS